MTEAMREQFEAEAKSRFWDVRRYGEQYVNTATQHSWEGYQAALSSPAVVALVEAAQPFRKDPNPCGRGDHFTDGLFVTLGQIRKLDAALEALGAPKLCHCGNLTDPHSMGVPGCHYYGKCDVCRKPFGGPAYGFPDVLCKSCHDAALAACTPAKEEGR